VDVVTGQERADVLVEVERRAVFEAGNRLMVLVGFVPLARQLLDLLHDRVEWVHQSPVVHHQRGRARNRQRELHGRTFLLMEVMIGPGGSMPCHDS
jgi:hypothetical protein